MYKASSEEMDLSMITERHLRKSVGTAK